MPDRETDTNTSALASEGARHEAQLEARYEAIYLEHAGRVFRYAVRRGCSSPEAEDVVAETFLVAWRRLEGTPTDCLPWLLAVARRVLANKHRADRRLRSFLTGFPRSKEKQKPPSAQVEARELLQEVFALLGERDREALLLVSWDGLSHAQAAQVLGCSEKALTARVGRARARLVQHLGL